MRAFITHASTGLVLPVCQMRQGIDAKSYLLRTRVFCNFSDIDIIARENDSAFVALRNKAALVINQPIAKCLGLSHSFSAASVNVIKHSIVLIVVLKIRSRLGKQKPQMERCNYTNVVRGWRYKRVKYRSQMLEARGAFFKGAMLCGCLVLVRRVRHSLYCLECYRRDVLRGNRSVLKARILSLLVLDFALKQEQPTSNQQSSYRADSLNPSSPFAWGNCLPNQHGGNTDGSADGKRSKFRFQDKCHGVFTFNWRNRNTLTLGGGK